LGGPREVGILLFEESPNFSLFAKLSSIKAAVLVLLLNSCLEYFLSVEKLKENNNPSHHVVYIFIFTSTSLFIGRFFSKTSMYLELLKYISFAVAFRINQKKWQLRKMSVGFRPDKGRGGFPH